MPSIDTWQQWVYGWTPTTTGVHTLRVRATDRDGKVQIGSDADPYPGRGHRLAHDQRERRG